MSKLKPRGVRLTVDQNERLQILAFVLNVKMSEVFRLAVDRLYEVHRDKVEAVRPAYEAAQAAMEQARQAAQDVGGGRVG